MRLIAAAFLWCVVSPINTQYRQQYRQRFPYVNPYGMNPRFFLVPLNGGSGGGLFGGGLFGQGSSTTNVNNPFLITGSACSGYNILTQEILSGTCQDYASCLLKGHTIGGTCNLGLKTCCIPKRLTTTITNPEPVGDHTYTIHPYSNQYCQIRLDFEDFVIGDPTGGSCSATEQFTVTGQKGPESVPTLCGVIGTTGQNQHMYLEFATSPSTKRPEPIELVINTAQDTSMWSIKVTQIMCNDQENLAPSGCLQYFTESTGSVCSFNYRERMSPPLATDEPNQLNDMNYKICLSKTASSATWSNDGTPYSFSLTENAAIGSGSIGRDAQCNNDYVSIPFGIEISGQSMSSISRVCGLGFPTTVQSDTLAPFIQYVTDMSETTDVANNGFKLLYTTTQ